VLQRRWSEALKEFDQARADYAQLEDPNWLYSALANDMTIVIAEIYGGRLQQAIETSRLTLDRRRKFFGDQQYKTAEAQGFMAAALASTGARDDAMAHFQAAIPILLKTAGDTVDESGGTTESEFRLRFILENYLSLLGGQSNSGSQQLAIEAFQIADTARGRSVQRALAAAAARGSVKDPVLADLIRREQDAQRQITALNGIYASALAVPTDQQDHGTLAALPQQIELLRAARATIKAEVEGRFPDYAILVGSKPASVAATQAVLHPAEALIAFYVAEDRTYVWAIPKSGPVAFTAAPLGRAEVDRIVAQLRRALEPNASTLGEIPPFDVSSAYKLYASLLQPVEAGWEGAKSLLIVPHGALGQLPLGLLVTAPATVESEQEGKPLFSSYRSIPWLIREVAVSERVNDFDTAGFGI
jgi:hypothetical protein